MKILKDTTEPIYETWDDPGDYPNGLAAGPLPSSKHFAGVEGELQLALDEDEFELFVESVCAEGLDDWFNNEVPYDNPSGVFSIQWQLDEVDVRKLTLVLSAKDAEQDDDYYPEPEDVR
jgi:hypothetical protein